MYRHNVRDEQTGNWNSWTKALRSLNLSAEIKNSGASCQTQIHLEIKKISGEATWAMDKQQKSLRPQSNPRPDSSCWGWTKEPSSVAHASSILHLSNVSEQRVLLSLIASERVRLHNPVMDTASSPTLSNRKCNFLFAHKSPSDIWGLGHGFLH